MGGDTMFEEINTKLVEIQGELRKVKKYQSQLADYEKELEMITEAIAQLNRQLESEQKDVTKLERLSLTRLFATLSGTKDEKLTKEKQELVVAQHKLAEAEKTKREIDEAVLEIRNNLYTLDYANNEYQNLLLQKAEMVMNSSSPAAAKMLELSEQEGIFKTHLIELREAIDAGDLVKSALKEAMKSLESAGNWGTFDLLGGGFISDMAKHSHIDEAERNLHRAQTSMRHFQKELLDVNQQTQLEINISDMLKFADFFFDGFIADFMVQDKIKKASNQIETQYNQVREILGKLNEQYIEHKGHLERVQIEKQEIIQSM
jgi:tetratricopeptide (TPR) repeat protein